MAEIEYGDWMSESDALMWHMERDPLLRSTITSVWVLDRSPDPDRLQAAVAGAIADIPRLRQRVVADRAAIAPPKWELDPLFDPTYHLRSGRLGGAGTLRDLLDHAAPLAGQAFDKDRPLWELHVLDGMADGRAGVIMKLHHAISDGVGLVKMTGSLLERSREPPDDTPRQMPPAGDPPHRAGDGATRLGDALRHQAETGLRRSAGLMSAAGRGAFRLARDPLGTSQAAVGTVGSIARSLRPVNEPMSPIMVGRSMSVRFDALQIEIARLKRAGSRAEGTVNDAYVAAVLGGLARYHRHHGADVGELRMTMPINIRSAGDRGATAGNAFAPARFAVPLTIDDPVERMATVRELVRRQRAEPAYARVGGISAALYSLGPSVFTRLTGSMLKAIDFVTSNVPGPPFPVYTSGALVERNIPFGPLGGAGLNLTLYGYDGIAEVGINVDVAAVPDGDVLTACLRESFEEVGALS
ncbi:MAG: DUF1298 domain-containing protein [Ilumatobacter sp.]|nr:DUF1298 domain-containing protein [Ilumatobacter sp.]